MAVGVLRRVAAAGLVLSVLAGCGGFVRPEPTALATMVGTAARGAIEQVQARRTGGAAAPAPRSREALEERGVPVLRAVIATRGADILMTPADTKGDVVTWAASDGTTYTFRQGVLIQTRGLGPDLMSALAPTVAQLLTEGVTYPRQYFFLGADDRTTRRSYDCTPRITGIETIEILGRMHEVTKVSEDCSRPQGSITNEYWIEGQTVRKSRELLSGGAGFVEFERVID